MLLLCVSAPGGHDGRCRRMTRPTLNDHGSDQSVCVPNHGQLPSLLLFIWKDYNVLKVDKGKMESDINDCLIDITLNTLCTGTHPALSYVEETNLAL
jgi:hypothetical protein